MLTTARTISELGVDGVKIHLLYVVRGTPLEEMYRKGGYRCLEQQEYVDLVCDFLEHIPPQMVIQRLTGDPHSDELVAPQWACEKTDTLRKINETLENRNSWQGSKAGGL
jgi:radical SAM protein (TIGR01212 family)